MEIRITRGKEFLKDNKIRVTLTIETLSLSAEDQALVAKYGDPLVETFSLADVAQYAKYFEPKMVDPSKALSKFKVTTSTIGKLQAIREYEQTLVERLRRHLTYLRALDEWDGEEKLSL